MSTTSIPARAGRYRPADCRVEDLAALVAQTTDVRDYPHAGAVADVEQARACVAGTIERFGRIDGLVCSAGLTSRGTLLDTTPELFDQHVVVNLRGPFFLMQAAVAAGLDDGLPLRSAEPQTAFPAGPPWTFFIDRLAAAFRAELLAFTEVVAGTRTTPCSVCDAVESSWVAEACMVSWREHRLVALTELR